jgi:hypothetical protein
VGLAKVGAPLLRVQEPIRPIRVLGPRVVTGHHRSVLESGRLGWRRLVVHELPFDFERPWGG